MAPSALFSTCARNVHAWAGGDCLLCGAESGPELLCPACIGELPALPESCPQCALPSPAAAVCGSCINRSPHFDATLALWRYEFPCDGLVQALKYRAQFALAGFFARSLASRPLPEVDVVLPMPLHAKRLAERGFNQALEIARGLARYRGTPIEPRGVLRVKNTPPQTELPYEDRAKNVRGAFRCELDLSGASVAVLDDVMTTGATLNELARVLKRAGARRVENFVIARTVLR
ncbi:MAG: ComF family protein [Betaproteobacteria bacterium]|nr:MAG: ComF family protein [Betaproteobacteria bacterium]TMH93086.1 MAG: ComF family protein [Betaproteobacteria bacterium]